MRTGITVIGSIGSAAALGLLLCRRSRTRRRVEQTPARPTGLEHLTDRELDRAWGHTTHKVATTSDPVRRLTVVITRQLLLDELTARGRFGTSGWTSHDKVTRAR